MAGGAVADFLPHLCSLAYFLVGPHRTASSIWVEPGDGEPGMRALVQAERGTASLSFSAATQPDGFWVRVHGTKARAEANLFEPRLTIERVRSAPTPLFPLLNGAAEIAAVGRAAVGGLWGKLSGAPGAYAGLWELVARTYESIATGGSPPVTPDDIRAVNALIADLVAEQHVS
jgi:predicted dehydrogenase